MNSLPTNTESLQLYVLFVNSLLKNMEVLQRKQVKIAVFRAERVLSVITINKYRYSDNHSSEAHKHTCTYVTPYIMYINR